MGFLGIDTSNYTTSTAFITDEDKLLSVKKLLPVKKGEIGIRQSDAVFHHTAQLPQNFEKIFPQTSKITAIGVSDKPRNIEGSYMPCFTAGLASAKILSSVLNIPLYTFSHQQGHITAGLYSCGRLDLLKSKFLAFHISGGTTEALIVDGNDNAPQCMLAAKTLDLNAGQIIDRVGVKLGLDFPCGPQLEQLASLCPENIKIKPTMKGNNCCLSGVENICDKMIKEKYPNEYIAKYCIIYILKVILSMCEGLIKEYGKMPVLCVGGVMSNSLIKKCLTEKLGAYFAKPEFSADNAAGIAVLTKLKYNKEI